MSGFNKNSQSWEAPQGDYIDGEHLAHCIVLPLCQITRKCKKGELTVRASTRIAFSTAISEMGSGKVCWELVWPKRGAFSGLLILAGSLQGWCLQQQLTGRLNSSCNISSSWSWWQYYIIDIKQVAMEVVLYVAAIEVCANHHDC